MNAEGKTIHFYKSSALIGTVTNIAIEELELTCILSFCEATVVDPVIPQWNYSSQAPLLPTEVLSVEALVHM